MNGLLEELLAPEIKYEFKIDIHNNILKDLVPLYIGKGTQHTPLINCDKGTIVWNSHCGEVARNHVKRAAYSQPLAIDGGQWASTSIHKLRCFRLDSGKGGRNSS